MNKLYKKLRKICWVLHESFSMLGDCVYIEHQIQEINEAIKELEKR